MCAGLLAKAVGQSQNELTDLPPSRASPLPHKPAPTLCWVYTQKALKHPYSFYCHSRPRSTIVATVPVHF